MTQQLVTVVWSAIFVVTGLIPWYVVRRRDRAEQIIAITAYLGLILIMTWMLATYRQPAWWSIPLGFLLGTAIVIKTAPSRSLD